jgi:hypothetical protein
MSGPTFGDCMRRAREGLAAAETTSCGANTDVTGDLCGIVSALISLSNYVMESRGIGMDFPLTALDAWERAALSTHQSLRLARRFLLEVSESGTNPETSPLAAIAVPLQAGADLLNTHRKRSAGQPPADCSPWAQVAMCSTVSRAITAELGRWSGLIAPWALWASQSAPPHLAGELLAVSRCLQTAHAASSAPVTWDDKELLDGIPAAYPPGRIPPAGDETVSALCDGITLTAERLRLAAFIAPDHAAWSPSVSARAWERSARAAAIASHTAAQTLRLLTTRPAMLHPANAEAVLTAEGNMLAARDAWLRTSQLMGQISTESAHSLTRTTVEAQDLMLRLGRLASGNPRWTPAGQEQKPDDRVVAALAPNPPAARSVLAAVHQSADALAVLADRDLAAVTTAAAAGRLYVPTRQLPPEYDVPRPYGAAPDDRIAELMTAYLSTLTATRTAATHLADLALTTEAPSKVLALARRATSTRNDPRERTAAQLAAQDRSRATPAGNRHPAPHGSKPVNSGRSRPRGRTAS